MIHTLLKIFILLLTFQAVVAQKIINVRTFGAVGDGKADDTKAFQSAIDLASNQSNAIVIVPLGQYKITKTISLSIKSNSIIKISGKSNNTGKYPILFTKSLVGILYGTGSDSALSGQLTIENIGLEGNNIPYTSNHPYFNKTKYAYAIQTKGLAKVTLSKNKIKNFYGGGIHISNSRNMEIDPNSTRGSIRISSNTILNCWGLRPSTDPNSNLFDHYGDGIYLSQTTRAIVENNIINNDLNYTKSLGRGGIVLEYKTMDCILRGNTINGYDRGIHIENDFGGHILENNKISGSDLGIMVHSGALKRSDNKRAFVIIKGNMISNNNFTKGLVLVWPKRDRALISINSTKGERRDSEVVENSFTLNASFEATDLSFLKDREWFLKFTSNKYTSIGYPSTNLPVIQHDYEVETVMSETYTNADLDFKAYPYKKIPIRGSFTGNKLLGTSKSNFKIK